MFKKLRPRLGYANVMATIAVFLSLGGTSYALIINGGHVQDESLTGADVKNDTLTGDDVLESSLNLPGVSGLQVVSEAFGPDSNIVKFRSLECPEPKRVIAGGYDIDDDLNANNSANNEVERNITVTDSQPVVGTKWIVGAREIAPSDANWVMRVFAICADPPA